MVYLMPDQIVRYSDHGSDMVQTLPGIWMLDNFVQYSDAI